MNSFSKFYFNNVPKMSLFQDATALYYITDMPLRSLMSHFCITEVQKLKICSSRIIFSVRHPMDIHMQLGTKTISEDYYSWLIKRQY